MAMLAEPRQRKRYNLTPRGKALYEDDSRFGTKMLEKMGWSKGKGLGSKEDGSKDFIRVRMRNTNEGLGFEDRDDHWTQHEQDFSGLLKTLNGDSDSNGKVIDDGSASGDEMPTVGFGFATKSKPAVEKLKTKFSGESLEEKSKRSKARVHYKKFTKGKDLSQYSEKDLANIFGKKVVEEQQANGIYEQFTAIKVEEEEKQPVEENACSKEKENENISGVQMISAGVSVNEYFKQKMEALKNKQKQRTTKVETEEPHQALLENEEVSGLKEKGEKSKKKKKRTLENDEQDASIVVDERPKKKKAKKSKEVAEETFSNSNNTDETQRKVTATNSKISADVGHSEVDKPAKVKKKKSDQRMENTELTDSKAELLVAAAADEPKIKKKKKKSKNKESEEKATLVDDIKNVYTNQEEMLTNPTKNASKKSKKRKNQDATECFEPESNIPQTTATTSNECAQNLDHSTKKSRKKSKKDVSGTAEEIANKSMTLDELIAKCNSYNVYTISSFCAEKFRKVALGSFVGATLAQIPGYSYNVGELKLDVRVLPKDEERITALWNCRMNKYQSVNQKAIYHNYIKNVHTARQKNKRTPRFYVKTLKRKSAFQAI